MIKPLLAMVFSGMALLGVAEAAERLTLDQAKQTIKTQRSAIWRDHYSLRDAKIGEPFACSYDAMVQTGPTLANLQKVSEPATCVCVEADAKNGMGGYAGLQSVMVYIRRSGAVEGVDGSRFRDRCTRLKPFPELGGK